MVSRVIYDCDKCKKSDIKEPVRVHVEVGSSLDAAGSASTDYEQRELCPKCAGALLEQYASAGYDEAKVLIARIDRK